MVAEFIATRDAVLRLREEKARSANEHAERADALEAELAAARAELLRLPEK